MKKLKHAAILFGLFCVVFLFAEYALAADINGQLKKAQLEQFSSAPTGSLSRIFYDTTANQCKVYNGSAWLPIPFAAAALTQGSVPFSDSGGNLAQDNSNFYWDAGNARLGIGTASFANANDKLDVLSSGDVRLALTSTLGIGNASFWLRANSVDQFVFSSNTTATDATTISSTPLRFGTANTVAMTIDTAQKVGIGTQSPSSLFSVGSGSKFQVDSSGNIVKLNNVAMTWPAAHGSTGQLLSDSDGAGTLTWATGLTTARTISTTAPITGGGDLSANRTIAISAIAQSTSGVDTSAAQRLGTNTNDSANAGNIGEFLWNGASATAAFVGTINITSGTWFSADSGNSSFNDGNEVGIILTAGDWDVSGTVSLVGAATTTVSDFRLGIGTAKGVTITTVNDINQTQMTLASGAIVAPARGVMSTPVYRVEVANGATTTVYLKCLVTFASSTLKVNSFFRARRAR